jgi:hypothetical protein
LVLCASTDVQSAIAAMHLSIAACLVDDIGGALRYVRGWSAIVLAGHSVACEAGEESFKKFKLTLGSVLGSKLPERTIPRGHSGPIRFKELERARGAVLRPTRAETRSPFASSLAADRLDIDACTRMSSSTHWACSADSCLLGEDMPIASSKLLRLRTLFMDEGVRKKLGVWIQCHKKRFQGSGVNHDVLSFFFRPSHEPVVNLSLSTLKQIMTTS